MNICLRTQQTELGQSSAWSVSGWGPTPTPAVGPDRTEKSLGWRIGCVEGVGAVSSSYWSGLVWAGLLAFLTRHLSSIISSLSYSSDSRHMP